MKKGTFTDPRDGKVYKTVKIGKQVWMAENLAYNAEGSKVYDNDESNCQKYGRLYNRHNAMKACPEGWHLPCNEEWDILINFVGGKEIARDKLKAKSGWKERTFLGVTDGNGTDDFGFSALPGGICDNGRFYCVGEIGSWWSSTLDANGNGPVHFLDIMIEIGNHRSSVEKMCTENSWQSIRCLKGYFLRDMPEHLKTAKVCLEAVKTCGYTLEFVPENLKTEKICLEAVKQNPKALYYVPENRKTEKICLEAVKKNGYALQYVPEKLWTYELWLIAVKQYGELLKHTPENLKITKLCLEAVKQQGWSLKFVPEDLKTEKMCNAAVKKDGSALEYVPKKLKTAELCLEAVKNRGGALEFVPEKFKTAKLCLEAVKKSNVLDNVLKFVPKALKKKMEIEYWK
ncbi:MAG: DUF4116 domain-containing protein [Fibromonadaceae bacterium]|nr:DUF4116 domain-containing protein [Fibromonadaceae bacterium]